MEQDGGWNLDDGNDDTDHNDTGARAGKLLAQYDVDLDGCLNLPEMRRMVRAPLPALDHTPCVGLGALLAPVRSTLALDCQVQTLYPDEEWNDDAYGGFCEDYSVDGGCWQVHNIAEFLADGENTDDTDDADDADGDALNNKPTAASASAKADAGKVPTTLPAARTLAAFKQVCRLVADRVRME